ncbi:nuclear transport factor 2 family protein [Pseudanabaena sp. FACHB-2040]|uniref:nuclear transport factor 2 family protein n=1 Tax=Pseudanabaena sp. FACHB-2040 TaxID=2692859 RepID=UPI001686DEE4|nr:nuclear transport factor 2 family protein [Pseudanabaena sp. FACHB-2040]MBD2256117.1 nuclear transport factor 2 family protein [Pseudanabaena sp. FACHB-2040]
MTMTQDLIALEEQGWQALSSAGEAGKRFYSSVLRDDAVMLFPGGMRLDGKEKILAALAAQPWQSFQIEESQVISFSENASAVVYKVTAQREGGDPYVALINSTYVRREGTWQLVLHQQTPV